MKITELDIEGCLKLENSREDTGVCRMTHTYSRHNYADLFVVTNENDGYTEIKPSEMLHEYIFTDFKGDKVHLTVPRGEVAMIQVLNFPMLSDVALKSMDDDTRTVYIDMEETDQLIVSNGIDVSMILDLANDPIVVVKTSYDMCGNGFLNN